MELGQSGYLKVIKTKNKDNIIKSSPHHYITSNGISIFVGKNNIQNESLTFKFSKKTIFGFTLKISLVAMLSLHIIIQMIN